MSTPPPNRIPTADDLAGIPVLVEGKEDCTVRPRSPAVRMPAPSPPIEGPPTADDLGGIPVLAVERDA